jgi:hypothetical protein
MMRRVVLLNEFSEAFSPQELKVARLNLATEEK